MKHRQYTLLLILLCFVLFDTSSISAVETNSSYQFLDEWRQVIVDDRGVNVTSISNYISTVNIINLTDGIIEAEIIGHDRVSLHNWNLYQSHVGDYLIDSSRLNYYYTQWLETYPNDSENPNIDVLESSARDYRFVYHYNHRNVQMNFMGQVGKLYSITGNKSYYKEFVYDEDGVISFRKQHKIFENDSQLHLEEYYKLERFIGYVETSETNFSLSLLIISSPLLARIIFRKKANQKKIR